MPMNQENLQAELSRQTGRAIVAEGLVAAMTDAAMRLSTSLQAEIKRPAWEQKTGREGLEVALSLLRTLMGPLVNGQDCVRHREVLRHARALTRAVRELDGE